MCAPGPKATPTLYQRAIRLTGSVHTHDELILADSKKGVVLCGNAHSPHFTLDDWSDRLKEVEKGELVMAVFRWTGFDLLEDKDEARAEIEACLWLMAEMEIPYDWTGIRSQALNWIRAKLPWARGLIGRHTEYEVYCTESVFTILDICGVGIRKAAGNQPLPAPIHTEKLYYNGYLQPVANFGLIEQLKG